MRPPQKSESPVAAGQFAEEGAERNSILAPDASDRKELATLRARLAMAGHAVHELASGGFLVVDTRWAGLCKECPDLRALATFARLVGAS